VTLAGVPAGLTPVLTRTSATVATLTLTGTAAALDSQNADDVADITFVLADTAFAGGVLATNVTGATGPATSNLGIDFRDITLTYVGTTFTESLANDGTVPFVNTSLLSLAGDTFVQSIGNYTEGVHYTVGNVPTGMTVVITATSATSATVSLTGTATAHADINDVADFTITWLNAAFTTAPAANVTDYDKDDFVIDFADPASILWAGNFIESDDNDGSMTLGNERTATLTGDTFISSIVDSTAFTPVTHYTITGVPAGLTPTLIKTSPTVATLTLTGNATVHTDAVDVSNITITFVDGVFTDTALASNVANYTDATGAIDFRDVTMAYSTGIFTEAAALDGTISTTVTVTLAGDSFLVSAGPMTDTVEYTVANVPSGLTVLVTGTSATTATIQLTGTAAAHSGLDDIADLTVAFTDVAFAATPAANITNSTKSNYVVDYGDAVITYTGAGFTENANNNGGVGGSIIATISGAGATFGDIDNDDILDVGTEVTLVGVPLGLTPVFTLSAGDTIATLTFTGTASALDSQNADDVASINFTFTDSAFTLPLVAASVVAATGPAVSGLGVDFKDVSLVYGTTTFPEVIANNGTISVTSVLTLNGGTFRQGIGNYDVGVDYTVANVPAGMTLVITANGTGAATVALTGTATDHLDADDVADLTIIWLDAAFTDVPVANMTGASKNDFVVDFADPSAIVWAGNFAEVPANDGNITGTRTATLTGDIFTSLLIDLDPMVENTHYTITGIPAGMTHVLEKTSATVATLTISGTATSHLDADDVDDLTITFLDGVFENTATASDITDYTDDTGIIDFADQPSIVWSGSFTEAPINDGTVTGSRVATLTGDTFINAGGTLATPTHYILTGVPAGMTANIAVSIGGDAVTLTLTGAATDHLNIHDVSNITLTFIDGVFTNTPLAANVTDYTNATGAVDFRDPGTASIAYSAAVFNENALNNGTIDNTITLTLTGDTAFQDIDADDILDIGTEVLVNNLPIGLTAAITLSATDTVATVTLSGAAAAHIVPDSVTNLEIALQDTAFTLLPAASVTNATKSDLAITYINAATGTLTYGSSTFTESVTNNGSISSSLVVTLGGGGIFAPTLTAGTHVTFLNVPTGLTGVVTRDTDTQATLTLTGTAAAHADITNDIANLIVIFGDSAFTGIQAANVTNATKSDIVVDYRDITLGYDVTTFTEVIANDGTSTTTSTVTLTGDTFTQSSGAFTPGVHFSTIAVPTGMTLTITATSSTTATIALTGSATANLTNPADVTALTINWLNPAFTAAPAANITGYAKNDFVIDFLDQPSLLYAGNFTETAVNNGALGGSRTATLTGDTFETSILDGATFTENTHFTIGNKPAGLTAVLTKTSATVATLTFTGTATGHLNANDVANLTITFLDGAFENTATATNVTNVSNATGAIDFIDVTLTYSGSAFTEATLLDGSIGNTITVTLAGDTFAVPGGVMTDTTHYTVL
jgi:hypothetical protein